MFTKFSIATLMAGLILITPAAGQGAPLTAPPLQQQHLLKLEPKFVDFINGLFASQIGKQFIIPAPPQLLTQLHGAVDLDLTNLPIGQDILLTLLGCTNLKFNVVDSSVTVGFQLQDLSLKYTPGTAAGGGHYYIHFEIANIYVDGYMKDHVTGIEVLCPFQKISFTVSNALIIYDLPIQYQSSTGFKLLTPLPDPYISDQWNLHVNIHNLPSSIESMIFSWFGPKKGAIFGGLKEDLSENLKLIFAPFADGDGLNFTNPLFAAMAGLSSDALANITTKSGSNAGLPALSYLGPGNELVTYYNDGSSTLLFSLLGAMKSAGKDPCAYPGLPTQGSVLTLMPWNQPSLGEVTANIPFKTIEWIMDRYFDAGNGCFYENFDFSDYIPNTTLNIQVRPIDVALKSPFAAPATWVAFGDDDLDLMITLQFDITLVGRDDLHLPIGSSVAVITVPIQFTQNDAGQTFQIQAEADKANITFPTANLDLPELAQYFGQFAQFIKDQYLESLLRPLSNVPVCEFKNFKLNLGKWFGPDATVGPPGIGETLDLDFGEFFAKLNSRHINSDQQIHLDFTITPVEPDPDPKSSLTFALMQLPAGPPPLIAIIPGMPFIHVPWVGSPNEDYLLVTQDLGAGSGKYVRFGTPELENAYRRGGKKYYRYYALSYRGVVTLRDYIQQSYLPPGPIQIVGKQHENSLRPLIVYTRGLTRRESGIEENHCNDALYITRILNKSFHVSRGRVHTERKSKFGAKADVVVRDPCEVPDCSDVTAVLTNGCSANSFTLPSEYINATGTGCTAIIPQALLEALCSVPGTDYAVVCIPRPCDLGISSASIQITSSIVNCNKTVTESCPNSYSTLEVAIPCSLIQAAGPTLQVTIGMLCCDSVVVFDK